MSIGRSRDRCRLRAGAGLALALLSGSPAVAGGFFETLFGIRHQSEAAYSQPRPAPPPLPYADPARPGAPALSITIPPPSASGPSVNFCVRLCDGRYFPVQRHANMTPIQACSALCPAAKTKVFYGSEITHARASDGTRYDDLGNAYVYRKKVVESCTCNGKTPFGVTQLNIVNDPTLRAGDMVATETGLVKFTGSAAQLRKSIGLATDTRRKLVSDAR